MREDPIISGAWIKAALVILVGGAFGVGAYVLASDVDINLPEIDLDTTSTATNLSDTTIEDTTIDRPKPREVVPKPAPPPANRTGRFQSFRSSAGAPRRRRATSSASTPASTSSGADSGRYEVRSSTSCSILA
jgi:hypothetical protein